MVAESALPMMQNIADTMTYLQGEGRLLRAEHNHLCEAFLVMASSAGYLAATPFDIYAYDYGIVSIASIIIVYLLPYL